jgi:hypothetical protein
MPADPPPPAIEARARRRTFKGDIEAVRDIDLSVTNRVGGCAVDDAYQRVAKSR